MRIRRYRFLFTKKSLFILFLLIVIPVTYIGARQVQDIRNRAATDETIPKPEIAFVPGEIIVQLETDTASSRSAGEQTILEEFKSIGVTQAEILTTSRLQQDRKLSLNEASTKPVFYLLSLDINSVQVQARSGDSEFGQFEPPSEQERTLIALTKIRDNPRVKYAIPNYYGTFHLTPNDSQAWRQWHLYNQSNTRSDLLFRQAWNITQGSIDTIIAVIDSGIDYQHPDIASRIWINTQEVPGDGIDNDANGYIDDVNGWDFTSQDNDPMDGYGHGTHVAGIIGAVSNNALGVAGVDWKARIMNLKISDEAGGNMTIASAISAMEYASNNGAQIINASWGFPKNQAIDDMVA